MPPKKDSVLAQAKARAQELVQQRAAAASKLHRSSAAASRASPSPPPVAAAVGKRKRVGGPDAEAVAVAAAVAPRSARKKAREIVTVADSGDEDDSMQGSTSKGEPSKLELQPTRPRAMAAGHETLASKSPQQPARMGVMAPLRPVDGAPASSSHEDDREDDAYPRGLASHPSRPIRPQPGPHAPRAASMSAPAQQRSQDFKAAQPHAAPSAISLQRSSLPDFEPPFALEGSARRSRPQSARQILESEAPRDDDSSALHADALAHPHVTGKCARFSAALAGHPRSAVLLIVLTAIVAAMTARWLVSPAARSTYAVVRAISSEMSLAVGEALCNPGKSLPVGDGRTLAFSVVVERLRSRGEAFAADALAHAARGDISSGLHSALSESRVELRGDKMLVAHALLPPRKSWACWLRQDVASSVQSGIARVAERVASGLLLLIRIFGNLILEHPAVSLGVSVAFIATVGFALFHWSVHARNLVVDTMFDCALRELEALAGRAIPLAQLRPHVMDRLYNSPFSVMALRAVRHWPRVEARLKLDSRVHVDAVAETAAGLIQPCATWVSPLRLVRGRP